MTIWPKIPTAPTSKRHRLNLAKCGTINHFFNNESDVLATVDGNHTRFLGIAMYYPSRAGSHLHYQLIFVIVFCVVNGLTGIGDILNRNCQLSTYDSSFSGTLFNLLNNFGLSDLLLHLISCWAHRCTTGGQTLKALYCQPGLRPFYERNGFVVRFDERDTNNVNFHHLSGFIWKWVHSEILTEGCIMTYDCHFLMLYWVFVLHDASHIHTNCYLAHPSALQQLSDLQWTSYVTNHVNKLIALHHVTVEEITGWKSAMCATAYQHNNPSNGASSSIKLSIKDMTGHVGLWMISAANVSGYIGISAIMKVAHATFLSAQCASHRI